MLFGLLLRKDRIFERKTFVRKENTFLIFTDSYPTLVFVMNKQTFKIFSSFVPQRYIVFFYEI